MSGSGGGAGGSGTQKYEWNEVLGPEWADTLSYGRSLRDRPYTPYTGQRIAGMNNDQENSINNTRTFLYQLKNPKDAVNSAIDQTTATLQGDYLPGGAQGNPFAGQSANVGANEYMGDNPYFRQSLTNQLGDMASAYRQGTAADLTRQAVMSGAFGGSAHQTAQANNEAALAKQMGNVANQAYQQQYDRSAGLREADISRRMQNDQFGLTSGANAFEGERGRMMGAIGQGNAQQGMALQRAQAEMGIGDVQRSYLQDLLNQNFSDWQEGQNYPYKQLDMYAGLLSRAQGGMSPNMTTTTPGYSASPYAQALGAGLLAYGMMK